MFKTKSHPIESVRQEELQICWTCIAAMVAHFLRVCAFVLLATMSPSLLASATCTGKFPNPVTDICWSCILPLSIGNATVGPEEALWLYSDDGDGVARNWSTRTWLDGFYLGAPVVTSPFTR